MYIQINNFLCYIIAEIQIWLGHIFELFLQLLLINRPMLPDYKYIKMYLSFFWIDKLIITLID